MVRTTRRRLLVVGGLAALTGCSSRPKATVTPTEGPLGSDGNPEVGMFLRYDTENYTATLVHGGEDPVATENLVLTVDGERVADPWDAERIAEGDAVEVDARPFVPLQIEWIDPEDPGNATVIVEKVVTPNGLFETRYGHETGVTTFTYTGDPTAPTDNLQITTKRVEDGTETVEKEPLSDRRDALETGDEVTVEDVDYTDWVGLYATWDFEISSGVGLVESVDPEPPGKFSFEPGVRPSVVYRGRKTRPAGNYRITVDGEVAPTQFLDEYGALSTGDSVFVSAETGATVTVEWTTGEDLAEVASMVVHPPFEFAFEYDADAAELTATSRVDAEIDPEQLELRFFGDGKRTTLDIWAERYEAVTAGDAVTVDTPVWFEWAGIKHYDWDAFDSFRTGD